MDPSTRFPETGDIETSTDDYATRYAHRVGEWMLGVQEQATLRMLAPYPNSNVLDVGGGHGQLTEALLRNGHRVTVLSSSEECRHRVRTWADSGQIDFRVANVLEMPYPDRAFDVVISLRLLAHVTRWPQFLAELARVADKAVILDYPEVRSINYIAPYLFPIKKRLEPNTRRFECFRGRELLHVFDGVGFRQADRFPQYFLPMMFHRLFKRQYRFSAAVEAFFRVTGLTGIFGSPVILKVARRG